MARNYKQGKFIPKNPEKYVGDVSNIVFRSSWESKMMRWCDNQSNITKWASEEITIPYWSTADNKERRYFVDFIVQAKMPNGESKTYLIEIKPESQCKPPERKRGKKIETVARELYDYAVNQDKWKAAKAFAERKGMEFIVLNEKDLGIY